jgi:hypothetical protein
MENENAVPAIPEVIRVHFKEFWRSLGKKDSMLAAAMKQEFGNKRMTMSDWMAVLSSFGGRPVK